jgi:hypothetical protein
MIQSERAVHNRGAKPEALGAVRAERRTLPGVVARASLAFTLLWLVGCSSTSFVSTWRAPDATVIDTRGARVAAVVMMQGEASRRAAEDRLAAEISARGAQGIASYRLLPTQPVMDEAQARQVLEREQIKGVVVLRPVNVQQKLVAEDPMYGGYWGGYYGYGWGHSYGTELRTDTIVSIETLIYSLEQNKLIWGGQSKTTNPQNVDQLVSEIAAAAADELKREGLVVN